MCLCFVQPQSSKYKHYVVRRMVNLVTMHPQIMKHWKLKGISLLLACLLQRNRKTSWFCVQRIHQKSRVLQNMNICLSSTQSTVYSARTLFAPKGVLPWWCQWERSCLSWVLDECSPSKFAPPWRPYVSFCAAAANLCAPNQCAPLYIPYQCTSLNQCNVQCATYAPLTDVHPYAPPLHLLHPYTFFWTQVHSRILYHITGITTYYNARN